MTVALLSFIGLLAFVIHEFEEIIRFRPWIERHKDDERYRSDMIIKNQQAYPSTETIAIMILEEVVLFATAFGVAIWLDRYEIALAVVIANTLHLLAHIGDAMRAKRWTPGSITAAITGAVSIALVAYVFATETPSLALTAGAVAMFGVPMLLNLVLLQKSAGRIERWRVGK